MAKKDEALCAEMPAEHLTAETDWTQLCAEAESVSADEQTVAYLEADEMDFASGRFYLSEDFDANLGELVDHIVWLSYFLCSQIAM